MDAESVDIDAGGVRIHLRRLGSGPGVLLLHGFPQTHRMWQPIAPLLAQHFTVICPDLRGYGRSGCPPSDPDHSPYAKRAMANDMVALMEAVGFSRFRLAGHDRGGRVAYRLALDHPDRVERLAVLGYRSNFGCVGTGRPPDRRLLAVVPAVPTRAPSRTLDPGRAGRCCRRRAPTRLTSSTAC